MKRTILLCFAAAYLSSCSSGDKKLLVLANDGAEINQDAMTVVSKATSGHEEKLLDYKTGSEVSVHVTTGNSDFNADMPENGYYILNAKASDTLIGSYQEYNAEQSGKTYSTDEIKQKVDSLDKLMMGQNVSAENRNFFIPPGKLEKITGNADAVIIAPFHQMNSIESKGGKAPEVYRFYSIKEVRTIRDKINALAP